MKSLSKSELQFFDVMRQFLNSEDNYAEVMKCFHLYGECIIGADELLLLVQNYFENDPDDIFERFKNMILTWENSRWKSSWFCRNLQEYGTQYPIEWIDSSYSKLPSEFLMLVNSGIDKIGQ